MLKLISICTNYTYNNYSRIFHESADSNFISLLKCTCQNVLAAKMKTERIGKLSKYGKIFTKTRLRNNMALLIIN